MDTTNAQVLQPNRGTISVWMQAVRVRSLAISSISVFVGGALAFFAGHIDLVRLLLAWTCAIAVQSGTNLINVHYNYKTRGRGSALNRADPHGSTVVVEQGFLTPRQVWLGAVVAFAIGALCGIALASMAGWWLLLIGLLGTAAGYSYGGPPLRISYWGAGVPTVFLFMGPAMVVGTFFAIAGYVSWGAVVASLSTGLLAANILHINDIRDLESDRANHKRTFTTILGRRGASQLLVASEASAYLLIVIAVFEAALPCLVLATLLTAIHAISLGRTIFNDMSAQGLHVAWLRAVRLHVEFGVVLIASLIVARFV